MNCVGCVDANGRMMVWGSNAKFQLGLPDPQKKYLRPVHLGQLDDCGISYVACTKTQTFALSLSSGELYSCGMSSTENDGNVNISKTMDIVKGLQGKSFDTVSYYNMKNLYSDHELV